MVNPNNIVSELKEDESTHSIVYTHNGEIIVATGYTKEDALEKLYGKISIMDSKKG